MEQSGEVGKRGLEVFDPSDLSPSWKLTADLWFLLPAPGSLMPAAWAFVLGLLLLVGLRSLRLGVSRRALRLMRHYLRML